MKSLSHFAAASLTGLAGLISLLGTASTASAERVTILLDWFINPDHGPLFVAEELGLFEAQGLEVELIEPADPSAPRVWSPPGRPSSPSPTSRSCIFRLPKACRWSGSRPSWRPR